MLGALVEKVSGEALDQYCAQHIFAPLKMTRTRSLPPPWKAKIAPTEYDENEHMIRGVVHDPRARRMGGVAGHAGLFSTGDDLAKFAQALLDGGDGILSSAAVAKMSQPEQPPSAPVLRGFGWESTRPFLPIAAIYCRWDRFWTYGFHRNIDLDRSNHPNLHRSAHQRRPSAWQGQRHRIALESRY